MNGDIQINTHGQPMVLTRAQLKVITEKAAATTAFVELDSHHPSTTVELYVDPAEPSKIGTRYHISADGTYDKEQAENVDGEYDWELVDE